MKKIIYQGTFDIFHWMHLESIRLAKASGDYLIVAVNSDKLVLEYKAKDPFFNEKERADIIRNLKYVDEVVIYDHFSPLPLYKEKEASVLVVCEEWEEKHLEEKEYVTSHEGKWVVLPYVKAEFMSKFKKHAAESFNSKNKLLCEDCHRKL